MELSDKIIRENLFFKLADKIPVFVINDRVYYCTSGKNNDVSLSDKKVIEGPRIDVLERISDNRLKSDYENFQNKLLAEEIKRKKLSTEKNLDEEADESEEFEDSDEEDSEENYSGHSSPDSYKKLVTFVVKKMFPYLRKENPETLDSLLEVEEKPEKNVEKQVVKPDLSIVQKYIQKKVDSLPKGSYLNLPSQKKIETLLLNQKISMNANMISVLSSVVNGCNFAIYNNSVYALAAVKSNGELNLAGKNYSLISFAKLDELKKKYSKEIQRRWTLKTFDKLVDNPDFLLSFGENETENLDLKKYFRLKRYHEKDFGFEKEDDGIIVYVDVPNYVLKDHEDGDLYKFDKHKLGIRLIYSSGPTLDIGPFPLNDVDGPFYDYGGEEMCMGNYSTAYMGKMDQGQAFVKYLLDGRNVTLHGYTPSVYPIHRVYDFEDRRITPGEVKKRNLTITNLHQKHKMKGGGN